MNFQTEWLDDARRYYTNIVGKYGTQVQALLKKAATIEIETICPLHGPVWRKDIGWFIDKYVHWATYKPEEQAVVIAYASVYGNTENAANILASKLADLGVRDVKMYDVSATHPELHRLRVLPRQPPGLRLHNLQCRHVREHGKSGP